ncbi:MAG: translation initiation factor IF-2 [Fibromonadaceae bacterium]|jgi:translation initiation factor IF-2|nr:translation initiation factor IF-2 [Fibromonadaceae bacterium]
MRKNLLQAGQKTLMSNELISIKAWAEKHSFDQGDTFDYLKGKTLDGVLVKSTNTKVSEVALDSFKGDVLSAQKRKPANKGVKKTKAEKSESSGGKSTLTTLKKIDKPTKPASQAKAAPPKEPPAPPPAVEQEPAASVAAVPPTPVQKTERPKPAPEKKQVEKHIAAKPEIHKEETLEEPEQEQIEQTEQQSVASEPKKTVAFTADVSKVVDPAILARIQKSKQEKATMRNNRGDKNKGGKNQQNNNNNRNNGSKQTSATGYSGNLRIQPRQTENKAQAGLQTRRPGFGTTLQDVLSANAPAHKDFLDNRTRTGKGGGHGDSRKRGKKGKDSLREREIQKENIEKAQKRVSDVLVSLSKTPVKKVYNKDKIQAEGAEASKVIYVSASVSVGELASLMEQPSASVIGKCMEMNEMLTINKRLDFDMVQIIASEFGFEARLQEEYQEETLGIQADAEENLRPRHPVVTVMGHVDHGKTSLLDYIRKTNVVRGESGGITQHIGAYEVETPNGKITFLDTPGHEAFNAMRTRGSQVTDVIVLVVAADSMVMPQTVESIELAKMANVPILVAITKIDLPTANPDKIMSQLSERGVQVDEWGGSVSCVKISVKTGEGIEKLLETLALESDVLELRANPNASARGAVVESRLDAGKGTIATILVQNGTLRVRDCFVCGNYSGRVRALFNEHGDSLKEAGPSTPCQVLGFNGTPQAGDDLVVVESDQAASEIAAKRQQTAHERALRFKTHMSLEQVYDEAKSGKISELNLVIKTDVAGSCEALAESLTNLSNNEVKIKIVRKGVGAINDDDVRLASISNAIIVAFHLMPSHSIRELAEQEGVEIKTYRVIYDVIEEIKGAIEGLLKPVNKEEVTGEAEIRQVFKIPKVGLIAGCMVKSGEVDRESQVRVYRDGVELGLTKVQSLKRVKDDVSSVKTGLECGIGLRGYDNIEEGDVLIFFKQVSVARTLADVAKENK